MTFAIMHKTDKTFFAGFEGNTVKWTADIHAAKAMDYTTAKGQALCFRSSANRINVQQKPVAIR